MLYLPICLICLGIVAAFLYVEYRKQYVIAVTLKGLASICFVALGILGAGIATEAFPARLIVAGLIMGAVADVLLGLRFVFTQRAKQVFLVGILVFLLGHVLYLVAVAPRCPVLIPSIIVGIAATALLMRWIFTKIEAENTFKMFGIVYVGVITILNVIAFATMLTVPTTFSAIFVLGALLFLASDVVLILNTFGPQERLDLRVSNIALYYLGQLLIALSLQVL